jgi:hypothetical protein
VDYSETDLEALNAKLAGVERRRAWMSDVVISLRARNCAVGAAAGQQAQFSAMAEALRELRSKMEDSIIAKREKPPTE